MALPASRVVFQGETPYAHEREAIDFAIQVLPNVDPFHVWALLEMHDPSTGRLHELDLLVLGYSALYLVEIKSGPGRYEGDYQDWYRTPPGESQARYLENPYRLANLKAKILKSRLRNKMRAPDSCPRVEALVFLSHADVDLRLRDDGKNGVVTRATLLAALQHHEFPGAAADWRRQRVDKPVMTDVAQALKALGLRPRKSKAHAGSFELGAILEEGPGYQDRVAIHREQRTFERRARTYLVPQQTSVERRQQLRRAAERESQLLWDVRDHPSILRISDFVSDAELGPTVLFDAFEGGLPLDTFVRTHAELSLGERASLLEQVARALAYCHRKGVVHGALAPSCVLVRHHPLTRALEVRLFNFQLGGGERVEPTSHWTALASEPWLVYQAPELRETPGARSPSSDLYGLGALAFFLFTGRPPADSVVAVDELLVECGFLDPRRVQDSIAPVIVELIQAATERSPIQRLDDAEVWIELVLDNLTQPDAPTIVEPSPLEAKAKDVLGGDLTVVSVLGHGATSRVLEVEREADRRAYALKVSLSPDYDVRLREEAAVLRALRHPRIVQLVDERSVGGRTCLLLSLAGTETLHRLLAREGTVSLDQAGRYGDDLLDALGYLEEQDLLHRDIKPANLGVGARAKGAAHLALFDFSLANAPAAEILLGTAAYRDPFLRSRGAWDAAADRWSAAVTLHEMLTGVRPTFVGTSLDEDAPLVLAAERLDASVRDRLLRFFERALARDVRDRFGSAADMRRAWQTALDAAGAEADAETGDLPARLEVTDDALRALEPHTPIGALPLSARAKNALDRAGLSVANDLLALPDNRLSAIRGIGRQVAQEIFALRNRWRGLRVGLTVDGTPFYAGYAGENLPLAQVGVAPSTLHVLKNAGVRTLGTLASTPKSQLLGLARTHGFDAAALVAPLESENRRANERAHPTSLDAWLGALLDPAKKANKHLRELFGLEGPLVGRLGVGVRELAAALGLSAAALYVALNKAKETWRAHAAMGELRERAASLLDGAQGALTLTAAADALLATLPHPREREPARLRLEAAALLRVVTEVDEELHLLRLSDHGLWLVRTAEHGKALRLLGELADRLAGRPVLTAPGEVEREVVEAAEGTVFAGLPPERLVALAAQASTRAVLSSRLEVYPRGLSAARAAELSVGALKGGLSAADAQARVALRYPEAERLPDRPQLDAVLAAHGLVFDAARGLYLRPGELDTATNLDTRSHTSATPARAAALARGATIEADAVDFDGFEQAVRLTLEYRGLRVLGVRADDTRAAVLALSAHHGLRVVAVDKLLVEAMAEEMAAVGITKEDVVHAADRAGPTGPHWGRLLELARGASRRVEARLFPHRAPLLLTQLGLLDRYGLAPLLARIMDAGRSPEHPAVFVLVPKHDGGGLPRINDRLEFPGLLASQVYTVPRAWIRGVRAGSDDQAAGE